MGYHGGIASYDDWPEFALLLGCGWNWKFSNHEPITEWTMQITNTDHAIGQGIEPTEYTLQEEEVYGNLQVSPGCSFDIICTADYHGMSFPILYAGQGGRCDDAGKWAYFGNGHSLKSIECP